MTAKRTHVSTCADVVRSDKDLCTATVLGQRNAPICLRESTAVARENRRCHENRQVAPEIGRFRERLRGHDRRSASAAPSWFHSRTVLDEIV